MSERILSLAARNRWVAVFALIAIGVAVYFHVTNPARGSYVLRMTAGDVKGSRQRIAEKLAEEVASKRVLLELTGSEGSEEALEMVADGRLDLALLQGGLEARAGIRQVAALHPEPLHLFVRKELEHGGLGDLRGKRLNLSTEGSGTRRLAEATLRFGGLSAGRDYEELGLSYSELESLPEAELPDGIFAVQSLPSEVATFLITERKYRLMEIPLGEAMTFVDFKVVQADIPLMMYSADPPVPPREIRTVGNWLLLVSRVDVPQVAIERILEAMFEENFAQKANLHSLSMESFGRPPEYPFHEGTKRFIRRTQPLLTADAIGSLESARSFVVSMAIALFLAWRWYSRRRSIGFEKYIIEVTEIEGKALELEKSPTLDVAALVGLRNQVSVLKNRALRQFAAGSLKGEELMASFLAHATDVRDYLNSLILHERERLEEIELATRGGKQDDGSAGELWTKAMHGDGDQIGTD